MPTFVHELYINATPEQVWKAITDPAFTSRYFYGSLVESDWAVGSPVVHRAATGTPQIEGKVLAADPGKRLVLTQRYLFDPQAAAEEPSRIAYEIAAHGPVCKLTVTQDGFAKGSAAYRDTVGGWPWIASGMKTLLETGQSLPGAGPA